MRSTDPRRSGERTECCWVSDYSSPNLERTILVEVVIGGALGPLLQAIEVALDCARWRLVEKPL